MREISRRLVGEDTGIPAERRVSGGRAVHRCAIVVVWLGTAGVVAFASAGVPRTVLELQPFREAQSISIRSPRGSDGTATLVNLNPAIGAWYLLTIARNGAPERAYHLENPHPRTQKLLLDQPLQALLIANGPARYVCDLFGAGSAERLENGAAPGSIFQPLCGSRLYLRNRAAGRHTRLETAADFLRERVWGGEGILALGHHVMGDRNLETGTVRAAAGNGHAAPTRRTGPLPALIDPSFAGRTVTSDNLGIGVASGGGLVPGVWYAATGSPGVYVSVLQPGMIAASILHGGERTVNALDRVESSALCYLIAFDLERFELAYAGGTEHPSVGWSAHMQARMQDPRLPGPDGISTIAPLIPTGLVNPDEASRTVATFTGGFKRAHGAFLSGDLATSNRGSHYGFIEQGTVLSTLQPGLATIYVLADGQVDMKTWDAADRAQLQHIRYARQNGVPVVELDRQSQRIVPGRLVNQWGPGNWSGSEGRKLRTIRAAAAIQNNGDKPFLIYAVFSAATPSAMARVFQAYLCRYAMLLDMNALEHTYLALHRRTGSGITVEHLIKGMSQLDRESNGAVVPRFLGYSDNRDFFYVMHRRDRGRP